MNLRCHWKEPWNEEEWGGPIFWVKQFSDQFSSYKFEKNRTRPILVMRTLNYSYKINVSVHDQAEANNGYNVLDLWILPTSGFTNAMQW